MEQEQKTRGITKLEKELIEVIEKAHVDFNNAIGGNEDAFIAKAAAVVAKKYIERALNDTCHVAFNSKSTFLNKRVHKFFVEEWMKENIN